MSFLSLKNVSYAYSQGQPAVDDISLDFDLGEAVAIIGQNGAGKTTTVKMMDGLIRPQAGSVILDGKDTKEQSVAELSHIVGYVFQNPDDQIFQNSVAKEIAFSLRKMKLPKDEIEKRVQQAADICHLTDKLNTHPYDLPYSQRKFVTIAAIIAMEPKVLIFDEPTAGQDSKSIKLLEEVIKYLIDENKLVITITHDMEFVVNNFKRVIVLANAHKQRDATPDEIFSDQELLEKSKLEPPMIGQLATRLGYDHSLTINDLLEAMK